MFLNVLNSGFRQLLMPLLYRNYTGVQAFFDKP